MGWVKHHFHDEICAAAEEQDEGMEPPLKVRISHIYPPIPVRDFDYSAVYDDDEPNDNGNMDVGYGRTAEEAHEDLLTNFPRGDEP
jgi:hypothetical protein